MKNIQISEHERLFQKLLELQRILLIEILSLTYCSTVSISIILLFGRVLCARFHYCKNELTGSPVFKNLDMFEAVKCLP